MKTSNPPMHLHILGICGTFMGSLAIIAKQLGHQVTGSDANVYPPMSTQLEAQGIRCLNGYKPEHLHPAPDLIIVGNAMTRGNPAVEYMLNQSLAYMSGPQWLREQVLQTRWVLAVAGTHGKTTTASLLAWILDYAHLNPSFLIGGVAQNFGISARLTDSPFFVIEADEYDTAFFDKRSKFVHYMPRTLILNNLEYDHADIFPDLAAIQRQFHHLIRIVPQQGLLIHNAAQAALDEVLAQGCWTATEAFATEHAWHIRAVDEAAGSFEVWLGETPQGKVQWDMLGAHNRANAVAAIAAARHAGVPVKIACAALETFQGVKRRLELRGEVNTIKVYDDFAHHPTAIMETLKALRNKVGQQRILAVLEPRSNTMKLGTHQATLAPSLQAADQVFIYQPAEQHWAFPTQGLTVQIFQETDALLQAIVQEAQKHDHILVMSNGGFANIHQRLLQALANKGKQMTKK